MTLFWMAMGDLLLLLLSAVSAEHSSRRAEAAAAAALVSTVWKRQKNSKHDLRTAAALVVTLVT